jgi:hypothetical protein
VLKILADALAADDGTVQLIGTHGYCPQGGAKGVTSDTTIATVNTCL